MSLMQWLGLTRGPDTKTSRRDAEAVRRISTALEAMEPDRARWLAAFSYLLGRVAHADLDISDDESQGMETIVREVGRVPGDQAALVVEIAKSQNRLFGGTQNFLVAREFKEISTPEERHQLLDALFAVSAADDEISNREETEIRRIATELDLTLEDFVAARSAWSDQRAVIRALGKKKG